MRKKQKNNKVRSDTSPKKRRAVAVKKKALAKKKKGLPRTRNHNTWTESEFWTMIRSALRRRTIYWKPISVCRDKSRRNYSGPNKRQKFEYQCNMCKEWFSGKNITVDHITPVGSLNCAEDLPNFVNVLFCEVENLQTLCQSCHDSKTKYEKESRKKVS